VSDLQATVAVVIALLGAVTASVVAISKRARNGHGTRSERSPLPPAPPSPPAISPLPADGSGRWSAIPAQPAQPDERIVHQLAELQTQNRFMAAWLEKLDGRQVTHGEGIVRCSENIESLRGDLEELGSMLVRRFERLEDRTNRKRDKDPG
jgi:hypothetical protein